MVIRRKKMTFIEDITGNILLNIDFVTEIKEDRKFTYSDDVYELITDCQPIYKVKVGNEWYEVSKETYERLLNEQEHTFKRH